MSYYGTKVTENYTVQKRRLQPNGEFRFGGVSTVFAYRIPEEGSAEVPVTDSNPVKIIKTEGNTVSVIVKERSDNIKVNLPQLVDVASELKLQPGNHAVVLEGSLADGNNQAYTSETEIPVVVAGDQEVVLSGSAKVLVFTISV